MFIRMLSVSLLVATAAVAQQAPHPADHANAFAAIDSNGDGFVSAVETAQWAHAADRDGDGKLSRDEFVKGHAQSQKVHAERGQQREMQRDQRIAGKFAAADRNGDGVWDRSEIAAESRRTFEAIETAVNNDKTKKMRHEIRIRGSRATEADYLAHHTKVIAVADANKDGRITAAEYMKWTKDATK